MPWCPKFAAGTRIGVRRSCNEIETPDAVNLMDSIEKFANPVYSISVGILLRLKEFSKLGRSNPFFATIPSFRAVPDQTCS